MSLFVRPCAVTAGRQRSRTYYQVLGISADEQDPKVIEEVALRCSSHVRTYQLTRETECTLQLNEIAQAMMTLLDPARRREYDLSLGKPLSPARSDPEPPGERDTPVLLQGKSAPSAAGEASLVLLFISDEGLLFIRDGGSCEVKLVYRRRAR